VREALSFVLAKPQKKLVQAVMLLTGIWKVHSSKLDPNPDCPKRFYVEYVSPFKTKQKNSEIQGVYFIVSLRMTAITVALLVKKSKAAGNRSFSPKIQITLFCGITSKQCKWCSMQTAFMRFAYLMDTII
jgi:hypothetical protein